MSVTVRFAPSPTGKLHVGNVRAALLNWLYARKSGGKFMLRIDDTDKARSTDAYEALIREDLVWLGLDWDLTARQSERFDVYDRVAEDLRARGLLYPCYETAEELDRKRKLQRARGLPPVYDRAALSMTAEDAAAYEAEGRKPHWRFRLAQKPVTWTDLIRGETTVDTAAVSDPVLIREDGAYLYTLPSCIDDLEFGITHVVRGEDHVTNAGVQIEIMHAISGLFGGAEPPRFAHHSLLIGADGQGLSKRLGSLAISEMRADGVEAAAITSLLARLGTSDPVEPERDLAKLAEAFEFSKMGRAPARFDPAELDSLNAKLLHETPYADVAERLAELDPSIDAAFWEAIRGNLVRLSDAAKWGRIVSGAITPVIEDAELCAAAAALVPDDPLTEERWPVFTKAVQERTGAKGKKLFMPLRLALTGESRGPEMPALFARMGAARARARLNGETA